MKSLFRAAILFFLLVFGTLEAAHAQNISQDTSSNNRGFSRIDFFNNLAKAAKLSPLNKETDFNGKKIRLWISFSHSLGAQLLDIRFEKESSNIQWFVAWADWGDKDKREKRAEQWPCKTKVNRVEIGKGVYAACTLKKASNSEIEYIKKVLAESDIVELSKMSVEKRAQLDGKNLHIELLDNSGYYFQSFLNHHLDNHPKKKEMHNIRELVFS